MQPPRAQVQLALAYFLAQLALVSEDESDNAYQIRLNFIGMAAFRTHLFDNLTLEERAEIFLDARESLVRAQKYDQIDQLNLDMAQVLAASDFSMTTIALMLDYLIYFDEMDDITISFLEDVCKSAEIKVSDTIENLSPTFKALYKKWSK